MNPVRQLIVHHGDQSHATGTHLIRALRSLGVDVICEGAGQPRQRRTVHDDTPLLWIESGRASFPRPTRLAQRPSAAWIIDTHRGLDWRGPLAKAFDLCFVAQRDAIEAIGEYDVSATWLPLAYFGDVVPEPRAPRPIPVTFVGHVPSGSSRERLLDAIGREVPLRRNHGFVAPAEMLELYRRSRIVLNIPLARDLNMRLFEAAGSGAYVVTGPMEGLDQILPAELTTVVDSDCPADWVEAITRLLATEDLAPRAAAAAEVIASHHRYTHRACTLLAALTTVRRRDIPFHTRREGLLKAAVARHALTDCWRIGAPAPVARIRLAAQIGAEAMRSSRRRLTSRPGVGNSGARDEQ